jgi:hypothetical protein
MIKINLKTDELKKFISASEYISLESEALNPVLSKYILLDMVSGDCKLTKANLSNYCITDCQSDSLDDAKIPLDFALFNQIVTQTKNTTITITYDKGIVKLTDGYYNLSFNSSGTELDMFPRMPDIPETTRINLDLINGIKLAKTCLGTDDLRPFLKGVHLKDNILYSSNAQTSYVKIYDNLNTLGFSFAKDECNMICSYTYIDYGFNDSFNIFSYENFVYGFRKQNGVIPFDYGFVTKGITKEKSVTIKTEDFINFCQSTISINGNREYCTSSLKSDEYGMTTFLFRDTIIGTENMLPSPSKGCNMEFNFEPKRVLPIIKLLSNQEIKVCDEVNNRISFHNPSDDTQYFLIMRILL